MRNFLKSTFKFLSRSLGVAAVLFFSFQITYAVPTITTFTADTGGTGVVQAGGTLQVNDGQGWTIRWQASNAAGCKIDSNEYIGADGLPKWSQKTGANFSGLVNITDPGAFWSTHEELSYTITCYDEVQVNIGGGGIDADYVNFTIASPYTGQLSGVATGNRGVSKTITVRVVDQNTSECPSGDTGEACRRVCEGHEDTDACGNCKGPNGATSGACEDAFQCISENEDDVERCYISQTEANAKNQPAKPADGSTSCVPLPTFGFDIKGCIIGILDATVVAIAASFLQLCAYIFEIAIQISIVQFSDLINSVGDGDWLTSIWGTIRDILNIGVIFVLLYAAINVIVGRGGEIKKIISGVILFGVLTNFSLFLTKAALDLTNVIALEFYQQMRTSPLSDAEFNGGLGETIVNVSGLVKFYNDDPEEGGINRDLTGQAGESNPIRDSILYRFAMMVVFIAVGFIFLQAAGMFIARTISVILLLIFSPLMFAGALFSPLQKWIEQWHKEFLAQITVAPIFMILLYVVLIIMQSLVGAVNESLTKNPDDFYSFLSITLLTCALIIAGFSAVLNKAKSFSGSIGSKGASYGNKLGGLIVGKGVGGAASLTARLGQQTLGRLGNKIDQGTGLAARTGQFLRLNKMKDASFDIRNAPGSAKVGQGITKILSTATGAPVTINTGEALKGRETRKKEGMEFAQKKADTRIEAELKRIDDGTKQYDIFDDKIVDATGVEITRVAGESDDEWEKKVNIANKYEKGQALAKKNIYLASHPVATAGSSTLKRDGQKAQFKAIKAQQKKLSSSTKSEAEHQSRKDKLKAYKDELANMFASNASTPPPPPLDRVKLVKTEAEIKAMHDEEVVQLWDEIAEQAATEIKLYRADKKHILDNPNSYSIADQRDVFRAISDFEKLEKKAGGATKSMEALKKAIEAQDQKK